MGIAIASSLILFGMLGSACGWWWLLGERRRRGTWPQPFCARPWSNEIVSRAQGNLREEWSPVGGASEPRRLPEPLQRATLNTIAWEPTDSDYADRRAAAGGIAADLESDQDGDRSGDRSDDSVRDAIAAIARASEEASGKPTVRPPLADFDRPANHPRSWFAFAVCVVWILLNAATRLLLPGDEGPVSPRPDVLWASVVLGLLVWLGVWGMLFFQGTVRPWQLGCGHPLARVSLWQGAQIAFLALAPTVVMILVLSPFRSRDTQHEFLQMLGGTPDAVVLVPILLAAGVVAPLSEELIFRVTLQGWLTRWLGPVAAIGLVAAVFGLVHGPSDALVLLPLALILGIVYHQQGSYWALVYGHGLFNLFNIGMTLLAAEQPPE